MPDISFMGVAIVAGIAFGAPLVLGFFPFVRLPSVVLELVAGIVVGPSVLGWVEVDTALRVLSIIGLAFLLLIAGLEVDFDHLRGRLLEVTGVGWLLSLGLAVLVGIAFDAGGIAGSPLLIGIMLSATSLGVIIPVLEDTGNADSRFGQLTIGNASIAEVLTIVLLSLFFSGEHSNVASKALLLGAFGLLLFVVAVAILRAEHWRRLSGVLLRLQDTTAQIRLRGALLLLAVFVALAERFGLEAILGAFLAGAILRIVDRDEMMTHAEFRRRLQAAGFGFFVPFFFVTSGINFDGSALFESSSTLAKVPLFLAALLLVRGLPAVLYRRAISARETVAAALLQATSLGFFVVASQIGMDLGVISRATGAALVAAGLVSVLIFPLSALVLLRGGETHELEPAVANPSPLERSPA